MEKLLQDFSVGLFFWQTLIFVVLIVLLAKFAWKPILTAVKEREAKIKDALDAAENAKLEMAKLKSQNEEMRKTALAERDALLKEAKETKDMIVAEAKNAAKVEAEKIVSTAREEIKAEKLAAMSEIKNQVASLSIEIAEKIVKEQLKSDDKQKALVDNLIEDVNLN
ncbi:MAG: F0F1 ATP synthase subunit B [Flavobacteriales bacterium]|nr:F0F1 ATP synthase subunit B [Flavobacteriales bacterium]